MSSPLAVLPDDAVLVHIGPHKTGTTAIQSILANSRASLESSGVHYPGRHTAHHNEAKSLRQYSQQTRGAGPPPRPAVWTRFAEQIGGTRGRVVISSEFFAQADDGARARLVRELGADRVHLVAAARNPARIAISTWQQVMRTYGRPISLADWLEKNFRRTEAAERPEGFWGHADPISLLSQWLDVLPPERITVVAIDESDRRLLPTTFEQLLGLPEGMLADQRAPQENRGLSAIEAALIQQIAVTLDSRMNWDEYSRTMRGGVIRRLQEVRRPGPDEAKPQLPTWAAEQALVEAERSIAGLHRTGVRIVGDPATLRDVPAASDRDEQITAVPIELAAEAVVGAIAVATRNSWSLDAPKRQPKRAARKSPSRPDADATQADASPDAPADAGPARDLTGALADRVRAGLRRARRRPQR